MVKDSPRIDSSCWTSDSPFRPPDWRWLRATWLVEKGQRPIGRVDDAWVVRAWQYLVADRHSPDDPRVEPLDLAIHEAQYLYRRPDAADVWQMEAFLLTELTAEAVANRLGFAVEAVRVYERLFFCVKDYLQARDWITLQVIGPGVHRGFADHEIGRLWRAFAYHGGAAVLDSVIAVTTVGDKPGRPDFSSNLSRLQAGAARVLESARLAVAAMMLPANTTLKQFAEVYTRTRRYQECRESKDVSDGVAACTARMLDSAVTVEEDVVRSVA